MGRLQTARLENFIRRWGSIKGPGSVLSETLGDVFPILDLENLTPESQLTAGWNLFSIFGTIIGVAAQLSGMQLVQTATRNSLVVLDKIIIRSELAQIITYGLNVPLMPVLISSANRDSRNPQQNNANAQLGAVANTGTVGNQGSIRVLANVDREFEVPHGLAVLGPGGRFSIVSATVNSDITATFIGRERLAEPSELSF